MITEQHIFESSSGAQLAVRQWLPDASPRAIVQINHGLGEHALRYERFAHALVEKGYGVVAHDHRGHGKTTAPQSHLGLFGPGNGAELVFEDLEALHQDLSQRHANCPRILFGHSMGGLISLPFVMRHADLVVGAAIWNANFNVGILGQIAKFALGVEKMLKGGDTPSQIMKAATFSAWNAKFKPNRTDFDWLSRDEAEVDKYIADPLCGFDASVAMWRDVLRFVDEGASDHRLQSIRRDFPFNLVGGAKDPATDDGVAIQSLHKRLTASGFSNVRCQIYPEMRHESLNEINREAIASDFLRWLDQTVATV